MACCIIWLEMVKGNYNMIGSYTSGRVPLYLLRERTAYGCRLPPWTVSNDSGIQFLRYTCLSNQCDGRAPMHAVLEQKQRNPSSQLPCSALTYGSCCSPRLTNIAGITIMTIDLIHNIGLITIRNVVLRMGEDCSECPEGLHVDFDINIRQNPIHHFQDTLDVWNGDVGSRIILLLFVLPRW